MTFLGENVDFLTFGGFFGSSATGDVREGCKGVDHRFGFPYVQRVRRRVVVDETLDRFGGFGVPC